MKVAVGCGVGMDLVLMRNQAFCGCAWTLVVWGLRASGDDKRKEMSCMSVLVAIDPGLPNTEAFVKRKSPTKAALVINMQALNSNCPLPPPKFPLPTLLQVGALLKACHTKGNPPPSPCVAKLDLANCFWSFRLPHQYRLHQNRHH